VSDTLFEQVAAVNVGLGAFAEAVRTQAARGLGGDRDAAARLIADGEVRLESGDEHATSAR
jgi:hypothetical protein